MIDSRVHNHVVRNIAAFSETFSNKKVKNIKVKKMHIAGIEPAVQRISVIYQLSYVIFSVTAM